MKTAKNPNKIKASLSKKIAPKKVVKKSTPAKKVPAIASNKRKNPVIQVPKAKIKPAIPTVRTQEPKKAISKKPTKAANFDERKRYSEKDLAEFRVILIDKIDDAKKDFELLKITLTHSDDNGTDDTSHTFNAMEGSSVGETKEETAQLALRQEKYIKNLQNALVRIENKTYGICRITDKLIPKERLLSVPHATLCIDAKLAQQFNPQVVYFPMESKNW